MYHLVKNKSKTKPFTLVLVGDNGEPLNSGVFKTKQACFKNVQAVMVTLNMTSPRGLQDDTVKPSVRWDVSQENYTKSQLGVHPKYIPGKNPKKKK